jgi:hypothetical protein
MFHSANYHHQGAHLFLVKTTMTITRNNGYPVTIIQGLKAKLIKKKKQKQKR